MTSTLGVVIVHAPWDAWRRASVVRMRRALAPLPVTVVSDQQREGCWATTRRAWAYAATRPWTHALVLHDDFLPVPGTAAALPYLIAARPECAITLFSLTRQIVQAYAAGARWMASRDNVWGATTILPTPWIEDFLDWCDEHVRHDFPWDDVRLRYWFHASKRPHVSSVPCLVDHAGSGHSLVGLYQKRVAPLLALHPERLDWQTGGVYRSKASFVGGDWDFWDKARRDPDAPPPWRKQPTPAGQASIRAVRLP